MAYITLFIFIFIYLILPVTSVVLYFCLLRRMRREQMPHAPKMSLFALFLIYGGLLMTMFTGVFGEWSGMGSLGLIFLLFIAPLICGAILFRHRHNTQVSKYHRILFNMASGYLIGEAVVIGIGLIAFVLKSVSS